jgi:hypothetical protein
MDILEVARKNQTQTNILPYNNTPAASGLVLGRRIFVKVSSIFSLRMDSAALVVLAINSFGYMSAGTETDISDAPRDSSVADASFI